MNAWRGLRADRRQTLTVTTWKNAAHQQSETAPERAVQMCLTGQGHLLLDDVPRREQDGRQKRIVIPKSALNTLRPLLNRCLQHFLNPLGISWQTIRDSGNAYNTKSGNQIRVVILHHGVDGLSVEIPLRVGNED